MVKATIAKQYYCKGQGTKRPCHIRSFDPDFYCDHHSDQRPVATDPEVDAAETAIFQLRAADEPVAERRYQEEVDAELKELRLWKAQAQENASAAAAADADERRLYQEFLRSQIPVPMPTYTTTADVAQLAQLAQLSSRVDFLTSRLEEMQVKPADERDLPAVDFAMAVLGHVDQTKCLYVMPIKGVQCPRNKGTGLMCYCTPHVAKQQNRTMKYALELKAKFASKATTAARNKAADSIASGSTIQTGAGAAMDTLK